MTSRKGWFEKNEFLDRLVLVWFSGTSFQSNSVLTLSRQFFLALIAYFTQLHVNIYVFAKCLCVYPLCGFGEIFPCKVADVYASDFIEALKAIFQKNLFSL